MQNYPTLGTSFFIFVAFAAVTQADEIRSVGEQQDRIAIERLHKQDVEATLSDDADQLAKLWDENAVRLQANGPAEVSKASEMQASRLSWLMCLTIPARGKKCRRRRRRRLCETRMNGM